jgi:hypothetical protein
MTWRRGALIGVLVVVGAAWLTFGKDATRDRFIRSMSDAAGRTVAGRANQANWGDVAKKIGDFAAEERGLRDNVSRAEAAQTQPGQ